MYINIHFNGINEVVEGSLRLRSHTEEGAMNY